VTWSERGSKKKYEGIRSRCNGELSDFEDAERLEEIYLSERKFVLGESSGSFLESPAPRGGRGEGRGRGNTMLF